MAFQIGEKVVYPNQGVGIIEQISTRNLTGHPEMFYLLKLNSSSLRVMVPISNVENVGLRKVVRGKDVETILEFLRKGQCKTPHDWKGRFKENSQKMRSGSLQQVAEVFKSLLVLSQGKSLSFREKKMFDRAWQLLVDEIAVARGLARETVEAELVQAVTRSNLKVQLPS
ncbi:MAG: CarD family transcriptional regulator [Acidobacteria bacterium]|nr:CarD family transcriptional regulator [Acidobacteriota bacterium]